MLAVIFVSFHITSISFGLDSNSLPLELPKVTGTSLPSEPTPSHLVKPDGLKVIALVFFGRKDRVEIMRCFLEVRRKAVLETLLRCFRADSLLAQYGRPRRLARRSSLGREYE